MYLWITRWIFIPWAALLVLLAVTAVLSEPAVQRQNSEMRLLEIFIQVIAFWMIFGSPFWLQRTVLARRLLPGILDVALWGSGITLAGMLLGIWAKMSHGWASHRIPSPHRSDTHKIEQNHQEICTGPHRMVRHPLYAGIILAALGTAIVYGRSECFAGVLVMTAGFWLQLQMEERSMLQQYGEEYARYRRKVRALIPFVL